MSTARILNDAPATRRDLGYQTFSIGKFRFERDEYFAHVYFPYGRHIMPIAEFLRALMRDVAWGFFYGTVNFDGVLGTVNHYGTVDLFMGLCNPGCRSAGRAHLETFDSNGTTRPFE